MTAKLRALLAALCLFWQPPPAWKVSRWADEVRRLSPESSAEPGRWRTSRAEYQREIMDSVNIPTVEMVVIMSSAQVGKTELINNVVGYHIDFDPCPMLVIQPTLDMSETWSKDRLEPMLRDTPRIGSKVKGGPGEKKKGNKILHKSFPGGHVTIAGANAPASLASRPVRLVLCDEVDRYPASAGKEGDPVNLAIKRTATFWNRKIILVSTPTIKGVSRIESAYETTDRRVYHIPCPRCGHFHRLLWENVRWEAEAPLETVRFVCPSCDKSFSCEEKNKAVRKGYWIARNPEVKNRRGYHLSELYSPWRTLQGILQDFLEAKGDPAKLQVWINTSLGETWDEGGKIMDENELFLRCEEYESEVPRRCLVLTAGIDTQQDRLVAEVVGWGAGEESWSIAYRSFYGDPDIPEGNPGSPWDELTAYLRRSFKHEAGLDMPIAYAMIDSGGSNTQAVYNYVKRHKNGRIFAIKGKGGDGLPIVGAPNKRRSGKSKSPVKLYIIGVDNAKHVVTKRLEIETPGPGYCHFPKGRDLSYFRELTAEKLVTKHNKGQVKREWVLQDGRRNEALDCRVYAFAAFVMASPNMESLGLRMKVKTATYTRVKEAEPKPEEKPAPESEKEPETALEAPPPLPEQSRRKTPLRRRLGKSWLNSW